MDARENRFLADFSPMGCERLIGHLVYQDFVAGDYLFREGDPPEGVYLVLSGQVEIVKTAGDREQTLACFDEGDFLGEVAVLDGHGRSTNARAREDSSVAVIPTPILLDVLNTEPVTLTLGLFGNVLAHLRHTNALFIEEVVHKEKLSLIGEMAASLMHDLRNPVQVILSSVDVIRMSHSDQETVDCCEKMRLQCDRLVNMAGELLEFSRGESKLHLVHTDTTALLTQFRAFHEDYFRHTGLKVVIQDEPADIEVDSMRLLRVLQNLVTNAVEALGSKPDGRIEVKAWVRDSVLNLSVSDNGPGIPDGIKDRLFDPFVTQGKRDGTGLGMAIVRSVTEAHRGKITFETKPGKGTRFLIRVPQDAGSAPVK